MVPWGSKVVAAAPPPPPPPAGPVAVPNALLGKYSPESVLADPFSVPNESVSQLVAIYMLKIQELRILLGAAQATDPGYVEMNRELMVLQEASGLLQVRERQELLVEQKEQVEMARQQYAHDANKPVFVEPDSNAPSAPPAAPGMYSNPQIPSNKMLSDMDERVSRILGEAASVVQQKQQQQQQKRDDRSQVAGMALRDATSVLKSQGRVDPMHMPVQERAGLPSSAVYESIYGKVDNADNSVVNIGVTLEAREDGRVIIVQVDPSSAADSKLFVGDIITSVDSVSIQGESVYAVAQRLRGAVWSVAEVGILRAGQPMVVMVVRRSETSATAVASMRGNAPSNKQLSADGIPGNNNNNRDTSSSSSLSSVAHSGQHHQQASLGLGLERQNGDTVVVDVVPGGPSAGRILVGDVVLQIGSVWCARAPLDDVIAAAKGAVGSLVDIEVLRILPSGEHRILKFTLTRLRCAFCSSGTPKLLSNSVEPSRKPQAVTFHQPNPYEIPIDINTRDAKETTPLLSGLHLTYAAPVEHQMLDITDISSAKNSRESKTWNRLAAVIAFLMVGLLLVILLFNYGRALLPPNLI